MPPLSLRDALRAHTTAVHHQLDALIGAFDSLDAYRRYLASTLAFRAAVEAAMPPTGSDGWTVEPLANLLRRDSADLGVPPAQPLPPFPAVNDADWWLGAYYVLEGSNVGARLLFKRAQAIGLGRDHGARHLAAQATETRWPQFLLHLSQQSRADITLAQQGATAMFGHALLAFSSSPS